MPTPCTVTGNLQTLSSGQIPSGAVRFQLSNIGTGNPVGITGTSLFPELVQTFTTNNAGAFSCSIWGNDNINPANTVYLVTFLDGQGNSVGPVQYSITGASLNLNTAIAGNTTSPPVLIGGPAIVSAPLAPQSITGQSLTLSTTAPLLAASIEGRLFADQFSGSDASAKIQAAINALPAIGGTVDATNLTDAGGTGSTTIDPGTKAVTILLGPTTYNFSQVILKRSLQIIGMGGFAANGTVIQATGGNAVPPFILDQGNVQASQGVLLRGLQILGTGGNTTQTCFSLIAPSNTGLWMSEFDNIFIQGFGGMGLNLDGQSNGINQFCTFKRVVVFRPFNGNFALQIIGRANSLKFENCQFDGIFNTQDGKTNIFIGQGSNAGLIFPPYNIKFDLLTTQYSGIGMQVSGADGISIDQGHVEAVQQVFAVGTGANFGSLNITIHDSTFGNGTGVGTASPGVGVGAGYIIKNLGATANVSIAILTTHIVNTPDAFLLGNTGSIVSIGNLIGPEGSYTFQPTQLNNVSGFGNGAAGTAVTTTLKNTGTGPTTPQTVVQYLQVAVAGTTYWIPLVQ